VSASADRLLQPAANAKYGEARQNVANVVEPTVALPLPPHLLTNSEDNKTDSFENLQNNALWAILLPARAASSNNEGSKIKEKARSNNNNTLAYTLHAVKKWAKHLEARL
jgi:hypothetical protein